MGEIVNKIVNKNVIISIGDDRKSEYLSKAKAGSIVAFRTKNGKVKSAAIVYNDTANKKVHLETKYEVKFVANYNDVLWVKTGRRWPKYIFNLLKGIENNNEEQQECGSEEGSTEC